MKLTSLIIVGVALAFFVACGAKGDGGDGGDGATENQGGAAMDIAGQNEATPPNGGAPNGGALADAAAFDRHVIGRYFL